MLIYYVKVCLYSYIWYACIESTLYIVVVLNSIGIKCGVACPLQPVTVYISGGKAYRLQKKI